MKHSMKNIMQYLAPYRSKMVLSLLASFVSVVAALLLPIYTGNAIDVLSGANGVDFAALWEELRVLLVIIALSALVLWASNLINQKITYHIAQDLRNSLMEKIQKLPLSFLDRTPSGDIVSHMISDVDLFSDGLLLSLNQLLSGVLTIIGTLLIMFRLNVKISLIVTLLTPLSALLSGFIAGRINRYFKSQTDLRAQETAFVNEYVDQEKIILSFSQEEESIRSFDKINQPFGDVSMKATFYSSLINPSTRVMSNIVYAIVANVAIASALRGEVSIGQVSIFLSYAAQFGKPFNEVSNVISELQNALVCAGEVLNLLEEEEERETGGTEEFLAKGSVKITDVSFGYNENRILFEHFNLLVQPGEHVAIVGPTGCGKTTLINLLMRFYEIRSGSITLDEKNIRSLSREAVRSNYGMVLQDTWLKSSSVKDNIAYGYPEATMDEIVAAAKKAKAHNFIMRLSDGYDTLLSENGGNLSQGERQLLCIARVMLHLPNMLILDEATSSIDTRTELKIQQAFYEMMQGRTSFIVAHRLSTIKDADTIIVMNDGKIQETGSHEQLLEKKGFYYRLYSSQFENENEAG